MSNNKALLSNSPLHDPQIRYLYLAGTFEERLLLRLIAKYEKARANLTFMPDTLGVTADEDARNTGLIAGFAETQALLFEDEPPSIRTLDQVGEETNADGYRDLLHEIDRAFEGYERTAVRHGWLADRGLNADATQVAAADIARRRSDVLLGHVNLLDFVTAVIEVETGQSIGKATTLRVPADWANDLDGLPGFDRQTRTLHVTRERMRLRDPDGRSVVFLGRAHPVVRRAIAQARRSDNIAGHAARDSRVSAARTDAGASLSLLLTYCLELHSARRVWLQRVIAVLLPSSGPPMELQQPEQWLCLAGKDRTIPAAGLWRDRFACWAQLRQPEVDAVAAAAMERIATELVTSQAKRSEEEGATLERWLRKRADEICGVSMAGMADLFDTVPAGPAWQSSSIPLDRLAGYAADGNNPTTRRREANSVVELFQRRSNERGEHGDLSPPVLRPIGMLMLVPAAFAT